MIDDKAADFGKLLTIEQEIREAASLIELSQIFCNRTRDIVDFTQSALASPSVSGQMQIIGFSDVAVVDRTAPLVSWLEGQLKTISDTENILSPTAEDRESVADLIPQHILILPLRTPNKGLLGAFIVTRTAAFTDGDKSLLLHLASVFGHALAAHRAVPLLLRAKEALTGRRKLAMVALFLVVSLLPVRLTAIAPAEIVAADPFVVTAPMNGVVDEILVQRNQQVETGTAILQMVDIELKNNLDVAKRAYRIAEAELLRARQSAFSSSDDKAQLAELIAQAELRRIEVGFAEKQLERAIVRAPNGGIAIIDDPRKWQGRPVATGEQIFKIARPENVEIAIQVPVADAITLNPGSRVDVFLDIDPLHRYGAAIERVPYQSTLSEAGVLAYAVRAKLAASEEIPRIGLRGSGKLYGPRTSLFYFLFRRPITALRQMIGV